MGFFVLLCTLAAISGTLGYYGYPEPQNPGSCGCGGNSPSPPGSYPTPSPGTETYRQCQKPANYDQMLDKSPKYKNLEAIFLIRGQNTIYGSTCGMFRSSYGCYQTYFVKLIITEKYDIIFQTWTRQNPIRGLPPFPERYQFTEQVLRACPGPKLCGVGYCTNDGYYEYPGYCYTYATRYDFIGVSFGCNATYCIEDLGFGLTVQIQDGTTWLGPKLSAAQKDPDAALAYIKRVYNYTSISDLQESLDLTDKFYAYETLCEVNYNSSSFYLSSCGAYKTPYKENFIQ